MRKCSLVLRPLKYVNQVAPFWAGEAYQMILWATLPDSQKNEFVLSVQWPQIHSSSPTDHASLDWQNFPARIPPFLGVVSGRPTPFPIFWRGNLGHTLRVVVAAATGQREKGGQTQRNLAEWFPSA